MRSDERIKIYSKDLLELLVDDSFRGEYRGKLAFQHADVPYGYFKDDPADILWGQRLVHLVATASKDLATEDGTLVIKMGDAHYDTWRRAMEQAGWFVERDRITLIQQVPWMKRKAYFSRSGDGVNAVHFWMVCHRQRRVYYLAPKPFGTVRVCACTFFVFVFVFFVFLFFFVYYSYCYFSDYPDSKTVSLH